MCVGMGLDIGCCAVIGGSATSGRNLDEILCGSAAVAAAMMVDVKLVAAALISNSDC